MDTYSAALHMRKSGEFYTAAKLGHELNVSAKVASGYLFNIRTSPKYKTEVTELPNRTVQVLSIKGDVNTNVWQLALGISRNNLSKVA